MVGREAPRPTSSARRAKVVSRRPQGGHKVIDLNLTKPCTFLYWANAGLAVGLGLERGQGTGGRQTREIAGSHG